MNLIKEHIKSVSETGIPILPRILNADNRWMLYAPEDYKGTIYKGGLIYEHRLIMEEHLGKILNKDEVVHHKDGNKSNNKLENLELMSRATHTAHHAPEPEKLILTCDYCGESFIRNKNKVKYEHAFCCLSHSVKHQMSVMHQTTKIKHGTQSGYRHGCRCDECRLFHNKRLREYRITKKGE